MLPPLRLTRFHSSLISSAMPATRSSSKTAAADANQQPVSKPLKSERRRKVTPDDVVEPTVEERAPPKGPHPGNQPIPAASAQATGTMAVPDGPGSLPALVPAELPFSFEEAKQHLIKADTRFKEVFPTVVCTPYQTLDQVEPFR